MKLRTFIILSFSFPVLIIFITIVGSQDESYLFADNLIVEYSQNLFKNELYLSQAFNFAISFQLSIQSQITALRLNALNSLHSKISAGIVKTNTLYQPSNLNTELLYTNQENPQMTSLFQQNEFATSNWYQINSTQINQLSQIGQQLIQNVSLLNPLQRELKKANALETATNQRRIKYSNIIQAFSDEGILYSNSQNITYATQLQQTTCLSGKFNFDVRCTNWYQGTLNQTSTVWFQPEFSPISGSAHTMLTQRICQKLLSYNTTSQIDQVLLVSCIQLQLSNFQNYFSNIKQQGQNAYIIDPLTLAVISDSANTTNNISDNIVNLTSEEDLQSASRENITNLIQFIQSNFGVGRNTATIKNSTQIQSFSTFNNQSLNLTYVSNNTNYYALINPVYFIEKLPHFAGVVSKQPRGMQARLSYLFIRIISDNSFNKEADQLIKTFNSIYYYYTIVLYVVTVLFFISIIFYSFKLQKFFEKPIIHLIEILKQLNEKVKDQQLYQLYYNFEIDSEEIFLSDETYQLYKAFEDLFQFLQYIDDNYYSQDLSLTLLRLNAQIEFFKQFENEHTVGIIKNNIGCIHLYQQRYFEALQCFSFAIMYQHYEIDCFTKENQEIARQMNLLKYCISDEAKGFFQKIDSQKGNAHKAIFSSNSNAHRSSFKGAQQNLSVSCQQQGVRKRQTLTNQKILNIKEVDLQQLNRCKSSSLKMSTINSNYIEELFNLEESLITTANNQTPQQENACKLESNNIKPHSVNVNLKMQADNNQDQQLDDLNDTQQQAQILMKTLFERKKNFAIALIAQQENQQQYKNANTDDFLKNSDCQKTEFSTTIEFNDFWDEINSLLKQLIDISLDLDNFEEEAIDLLLLQSKYYLNRNKTSKSSLCLFKCKLLLNALKFAQKGSSIIVVANHQVTSPINVKQLIPNENEIQFQPINIHPNTPQRNTIISKYQGSECIPSQAEQQTCEIMSNIQDQTEQAPLYRSNYIESPQNISFHQRILPPFRAISLSQNTTHNINVSNAHSANKAVKFSKYNNHHKNNSGSSKVLIEQQQTNNSPSNENFMKNNHSMVSLKPRRTIQYKEKAGKLSSGKINTARNIIKNLNPQNIEEKLKHMIELGTVEYLIKTKNYQRAGNLLTQLLETSQNLLTHFPFKIISLLKEVFLRQEIYSSDLEEFCQHFNPNIYFKVSIVFANARMSSSSPSSSYLKYLQNDIMNQFIDEVLVKLRDEVGIIAVEDLSQNEGEANTSDCQYQISTILSMLSISMVKSTDLFRGGSQNQILSNDNIQSTQQIQRTLTNMLQHNENNNNKSRSESPFYLHPSIQDNNYTNNLNFINKNIIKNSSVTNSYYESSLVPKNTAFNISSSSKKEQKLLFSHQKQDEFEEDCKRNGYVDFIIENEVDSQRYETANKIKDNFYQIMAEKYKSKISMHEQRLTKQAEYISGDWSEPMINVSKNSTSSFDEDDYQVNQIYLQNPKKIESNQLLFHLAIRKSLAEHVQSLTYYYKLCSKKKQNNKNEQLCDRPQYQNYILYIAGELEITNNKLFSLLCECLFSLDIQLIIFSPEQEQAAKVLYLLNQQFQNKQRQQSFLFKETDDQIYNYKGKDIIKIFSTQAQLINYFQSRRNDISRNVYPTYIQSF